jgi:translation initiation factor 2B subunit (eIF-2B alpha/beta/delta family)
MVLDIDTGTALTVIATIGGLFWATLKLMFVQYERRQDERFRQLGDAMVEQKNELDEHMKRQDAVMSEIRRVEGSTMNEIRRVEGELTRCQLDSLQRYQTKQEANDQHKEILAAIRTIGERIDRLHPVVGSLKKDGQ